MPNVSVTKAVNREARRRTLLEDPDTENVEVHRIFCRPCQKWINLRPRHPYDLWTWRRHKSQPKHLAMADEASAHVLVHEDTHVSHATASTRRVDERLKILTDDPQILDVEPRRVFCLPCDKWIALRKEPHPPYFLNTWQIHKLSKRHIHHQRDIWDSPSERIEAQSCDVYINSRQVSPVHCDSGPFEEDENNLSPLAETILVRSISPPANVASSSAEIDEDRALSSTSKPKSKKKRGVGRAGSAGYISGLCEPDSRHADTLPPSQRLPDFDTSGIAPIIDYIKEHMGPSASFTDNEIITAARIIQEMADQGAMQMELEDIPLY